MLRTLFGAKQRPGRNGTPVPSPRLAVMIEKPRWDLTLLTVHFGLLTLKGYTTGEHVLRVEAITPNTILAGVRSPRMGRKPTHWTRIDRDYETLRITMQTLFHHLGITTAAATA